MASTSFKTLFNPFSSFHYRLVLAAPLCLSMLSACGGGRSEDSNITDISPSKEVSGGASKTNQGLLAASSTPNTLKTAIQAGFRQQINADSDAAYAPISASPIPTPSATPTPTPTPPAGQQGAKGENGANGSDSTTGHFTQTNNQVDGVDEADTIKFTGQHFFIAEHNTVRIVSAGSSSDNQTQTLGHLYLEMPSDDAKRHDSSSDSSPVAAVISDGYHPYQPAADLQLSENHLVTLSDQSGNYGIRPFISAFSSDRSDPYFAFHEEFHLQGFTNIPQKIEMFEDNNDIQLKPDWRYSIEGSLVDSRRIGDTLYVVSSFTPRIDGFEPYAQSTSEQQNNEALINELSLQAVLPKVSFSESEDITVLNANGCYLQKNQTMVKALTYVSKINMATGELSSQCVGSFIDDIYASKDQLFLFSSSYNSFFDFIEPKDTDEPSTFIHGFALNEDLEYLGSGEVSGNLQCTPSRYCIGRLSDGTLSLVTSKGSWENPIHTLHVLEHKISTEQDAPFHEWVTRSQLPNSEQPDAIGKPGERLYSVRYMQNRAYLVTFDKVDPLYVIDLSKTQQPTILGELEIPGYSDYLHPVNDDLLIGVGKSALTGASGTTWFQGVQVSLFDVSIPSEPKALTQLSIGKRGTDTAVSYSPKSFTGLAKGDDYVFALPVRLHDGERLTQYYEDPESQYYDFSHNGLHLFQIDDYQSSNSAYLRATNQLFTNIERCRTASYYYYSTPPRSFFNNDDVFYLCNGQLWLSPMDDSDSVQGDF